MKKTKTKEEKTKDAGGIQVELRKMKKMKTRLRCHRSSGVKGSEVKKKTKKITKKK